MCFKVSRVVTYLDPLPLIVGTVEFWHGRKLDGALLVAAPRPAQGILVETVQALVELAVANHDGEDQVAAGLELSILSPYQRHWSAVSAFSKSSRRRLSRARGGPLDSDPLAFPFRASASIVESARRTLAAAPARLPLAAAPTTSMRALTGHNKRRGDPQFGRSPSPRRATTAATPLIQARPRAAGS